MTKNQIEYIKQVKRLKDGLRKAYNEGYVVNKYVHEFELPKRITKNMLEEIRQTKPKDIVIKYGFHADRETGIIRNAEDVYIWKRTGKYERINSLDIDVTTEIIINSFLSYIDGYNSKKIRTKMTKFIDRLIKSHGRIRVASMLQKCNKRLHEYLNIKIYSSDQAIEEYQATLLNYLPDLKEDERLEFERSYAETL